MLERQEKYEEAEMTHRRALQPYMEILVPEYAEKIDSINYLWCRGVRSEEI